MTDILKLKMVSFFSYLNPKLKFSVINVKNMYVSKMFINVTLLATSYVPGTLLGSGDTEMGKINSLS